MNFFQEEKKCSVRTTKVEEDGREAGSSNKIRDAWIEIRVVFARKIAVQHGCPGG